MAITKEIMMTLDQPTVPSLDSLSQTYKELIESVCQIAERYYYQGRFDNALDLLGAGLQMAQQKEVDTEVQANVLTKQGRLLAHRSFATNSGYEDALSTLRRAEKIAQSINSKEVLAEALNFIGLAHYARKFNTGKGDYDEALDYFQKALTLREESQNKRGIAETCIYRGIIHERKGEGQKALDDYQKALRIAEKNGYRLEQSYALRHMAFMHQAQGDLDGALTYFKESLTLREAIGFKVNLPFSLLSVGHVYYEKGNLEEALPYLQKAQALAEELNASRVIVLTLLFIGDTYKAQNDMETALENYQRAHKTATDIDYDRGVSSALSRSNNCDRSHCKRSHCNRSVATVGGNHA
jgi:tetratricopeptide (TPR) repeat protein